MEAIVFTTNTGFTAEYARIAGEKTGLPVYSLPKAKTALAKNSEIVYFGWLMAGVVKGYKKAAKRYKVVAVCGVGMGKNGAQVADVRKMNAVDNLPVFTLQGGFDLSKLKGLYKFLMGCVAKATSKGIETKADRTEEETEMLNMIKFGANKVSVENLAEFLTWYNSTTLRGHQ